MKALAARSAASASEARATGPVRHVAVIDVIRGIAAISVALLHLREINWIGMRAYWASHGIDVSLSSIFGYLSFPVVWGSIGVPIFFVISGYVIHLGSKDKVNDFAQSRSFYLRRFVRIYPTLIAALLVTLACDLISQKYGGHEKLGDLSLGNAVLNLLATVGIWGSPFGSNGALWSLSIEIQFYALYPLALIAWRRLGPTRMLWATLLLSVVGYLLYRRYGLKFFMTYYFSWWLGAYVADRQGRSNATPRQLWAGLLFLAAGCVAFFSRDEIIPHMLWSIGFALVLHCLLDRELRRRVLPPRQGLRHLFYRVFGSCGNFSYSLYAIHLPVAVAVNVVFLHGAKQESIVWTVLVLPICLLVAYVLYRVVEVPAIGWLRQLPRKTQGRASLVSEEVQSARDAR